MYKLEMDMDLYNRTYNDPTGPIVRMSAEFTEDSAPSAISNETSSPGRQIGLVISTVLLAGFVGYMAMMI